MAEKENKQKGKRSNLGWGIACVILGAAVLVGIFCFFKIMNFTDPDFDFNAIPTKIEGTAVSESETAVLPAEPEAEVPEAEPQEPAVPVDPDSKACTGLTISQSAVTMEEQGEKLFLTAVARPSDCEDEIVYTSSDDAVVDVTDSGMITAVGPGTAEIIVTCGTVTKTCTVTCTFAAAEPAPEESEEQEPETETEPEPEQEPEQEEVPAPKLDKVDFTLFYPGEKTKLNVINAPAGAAITYVSANTKVVTVDNNGNVTAEGDGDTTITVTVGDVKLTCAARCRLEKTTEGGNTGDYTGPFKLSHTDVTLFSAGEVFTLSLIDANGKTVSNVGWFASNGCVTVNGSSVKAAASGQANVSCVYNGTTYSCIVRCNF